MSVEQLSTAVSARQAVSGHPVLHHPYLRYRFQPMVDLLRHLEVKGFTSNIASRGIETSCVRSPSSNSACRQNA
jgi:hypothetical protein